MQRVIEDIQDPSPPGARTLSGVKISDLKLSQWGKILIPKLIEKARMDLARLATADEKLLRTHLISERPVHIRRTLSQSYYSNLKNTQTRDHNQVVYRATKEASQPLEMPR